MYRNSLARNKELAEKPAEFIISKFFFNFRINSYFSHPPSPDARPWV